MSARRASLAVTRPVTWQVGLFALLISFFWSGNIVSIKLGLAAIPPMWSAFWRMLVATAAVAAWARLRGSRVLPARGEARQFLALSVMYTVQIALFNLAVFYTSPAYAVILLNTHPVIVNLISHYYVREDRLTPARVLGLAVAFAGIVYVMYGRPEASLAPNPSLGNALMLASSVLLAVRIVYTQRLVAHTGPLRPVVWQMFGSLPPFLALGLAYEVPLLQPLTAVPVLAILYQALVVAGFCFVAWTDLLQRHSAGNLATYGFTVPIFGVTLSAVFFGEPLTGRLVVGAAAVGAGIAVVTGSRRRGAARGD